MVPEKGRNARLALERELADEAYDTEWLADLINGRGKQAAKTGEGVAEVQEYVDAVEDLLSLNYYGRAADRPVFNRIEFTDRRIEGYESPAEAWRNGATRFYAGFDELLETCLRRGADPALDEGIEDNVPEALALSDPSILDEPTTIETYAGVISGRNGGWAVGIHIARATPDDHVMAIGTQRAPLESAGGVTDGEETEPPIPFPIISWQNWYLDARAMMQVVVPRLTNRRD